MLDVVVRYEVVKNGMAMYWWVVIVDCYGSRVNFVFCSVGWVFVGGFVFFWFFFCYGFFCSGGISSRIGIVWVGIGIFVICKGEVKG